MPSGSRTFAACSTYVRALASICSPDSCGRVEERPLDRSADVGLRGDLGAWHRDLSHTYGSNGFDYTIRHTLNASIAPAIIASIPSATSS